MFNQVNQSLVTVLVSKVNQELALLSLKFLHTPRGQIVEREVPQLVQVSLLLNPTRREYTDCDLSHAQWN